MNGRLAWALAVLISFGVWVMSPSAASAHADLESSSPAPSAILETSPRDITLDFSEPVNPSDGAIRLFGEDRREIDLPSSRSPLPSRVEVRDLPRLDAGIYLVSWRVLSEDGHVAEGAFTFRIGTQSSTVTPEELLRAVETGSAGPQGLEAVGSAARGITYLGLSALLGTLAFAVGVGLRRVRRLVAVGWCAAVLGTLAHMAVQGVLAIDGSWADLVNPSAWNEVVSTRLGLGLVVRLALLTGLVVLLAVMSRRRAVMETTWWRSSTAVLGAGILATFAATGHPSASSPAGLAGAVAAVHLAAIVIWIGGLLGIVFGDHDDDVVRVYSRTATIALPIAVVSGGWQAWHLAQGTADLTATTWGRSLVVKMAVVLVAATLGAVARWLVQSGTFHAIRRLVLVEVVTVIAVLGATSIMVSSPPRAEAESSVVVASLAQDDVVANLTVTPGRVGPNEIHLTVTTPAGTLDPVEGVEMRITQQDSDVPAVRVDVESLGPNHFLGSVSVLDAGRWSLEILVRVDPSRIVRLATDLDF